IELGALVMLETSIGSEWIEETGGQGGVDSLEEVEKDQGGGGALRGKLIEGRGGGRGEKAFGGRFWGVVAGGGDGIAVRGTSEGRDDERVDLCGGKGIGGGNMGEAYEGMHGGKLARVVKL